jgi:pimeloyl-ACP methyl ester carboxylesterase/DNA-binding CsgD family transcriptional regulator
MSVAAPPTQEIRYCVARDGSRLAYAVTGDGEDWLVNAWCGISHLEMDWLNPLWGHYQREFAAGRRYLRYDGRGCGLSEHDSTELDFASRLEELEVVLDAAGAKRASLYGFAYGGALAVAFAVRHPQRVERLVLCCPLAWSKALDDAPFAEKTRLAASLTGQGLERGRMALVSSEIVSTQSRPQTDYAHRLLREGTSPAALARIAEDNTRVDIRPIAARVGCPTLIFHITDNPVFRAERSQWLAAAIPGARLVLLKSASIHLQPEEPAWALFRQEMRGFLRRDPATPLPPDLTLRELEVLERVALGHDDERIAAELGVSRSTVRNHLASLFAKLGVSRRAQAIVLAHESGLGRGSP